MSMGYKEILAKISSMDEDISDENIDSLLLFFQESVTNLNIHSTLERNNNDILACPKCMELLHDPITVHCGHTYCRSCLVEGSKCEICFVNISPNKVKPNIVLTNVCQKWFSKQYQSRELAAEGNVFLTNKEYPAAIESYTKALELVPWSHNSFLNRGIAYFELNSYEKSLQDIENAIKHHKNLPKAFLIKAAIHEKYKRYPQALLSYFECLALGYGKSEIDQKLKKLFLQLFNIFPSTTKARTKLDADIQKNEKSLKRKNDGENDSGDNKKLKLSTEDAPTSPNEEQTPFEDDDMFKDNIEMLANYFPSVVSNENPTWAICHQDILTAAVADVVTSEFNESEDQSLSNDNADDEMPEMEPIPISTEIQSIDAYEELKQQILSEMMVTFTTSNTIAVRGRGCGLKDIDPKLVEVSDFECSLCMRLYYKPICTICGHVFCLECFQRSLDHSSHCPLCKQFITQNSADATNGLVVEVIANTLLTSFLPEAHKERINLEEIEIKVYKENFPVFVCTAAFPSIACPLHIFEPKYRLMLRRAMKYHNKQFGMCLQSTDKPFHQIGTMLFIRNVKYFPDGRAVVDSIGTKRFRATNQSKLDGYNTCSYTMIADQPIQSTKEVEATEKLYIVVYMRAREWYDNLKSNIQQQIIHHYGKFPEKGGSVHGENGPDWHWWVLAVLPVENKVKVTVLEKGSLRERFLIIHRVLTCLKQRSQTASTSRQ